VEFATGILERITWNLDPTGGSPFSGAGNLAEGVGGTRLQIKLARRLGAFLVGDAGGEVQILSGKSWWAWDIRLGNGPVGPLP
jgi:hypothetical protein